MVFSPKEKLILKTISKALKLTILSMLILVCFAYVYDYINQKQYNRIMEEKFYQVVMTDIKGNQSMFNGMPHPLPEEIVDIQILLLGENFSQIKAAVLVNTPKNLYKYSVIAKGKFGIPIIFGYDKVDALLNSVGPAMPEIKIPNTPPMPYKPDAQKSN